MMRAICDNVDNDVGMLLLAAIMLAWLLGHIMGRAGEAYIWRSKAGFDEGRTANCSAGKFYYVLPEKQYIDWLLNPHRLEQMRLDRLAELKAKE